MASEAYDTSHLVEGTKDNKILSFRTKLETADLSEQSDIDELNAIIAEVAAEDPAQAETLKEEFMAKKIA